MKIIGKSMGSDSFGGLIRSKGQLSEHGKLRGIWEAVARDKFGKFLWKDVIDPNLVVNVGLSYALDCALGGATQITTWYVGLTNGTPTVAAGDTMASHAGWNEIVDIAETHRPPWVDGGESGQSIDNSASPAQLTIVHDGTVIGGAFLSSSDQPGGTAGTLYAAGAFSGGDKTLGVSDTIDVTATFTMADDGV